MSASLAARPQAVGLPLPLPPKVSARSSVDSRHSAFQTWLLADASCSSPYEVMEKEPEKTAEQGVSQGSLTTQVSPPEPFPLTSTKQRTDGVHGSLLQIPTSSRREVTRAATAAVRPFQTCLYGGPFKLSES